MGKSEVMAFSKDKVGGSGENMSFLRFQIIAIRHRVCKELILECTYKKVINNGRKRLKLRY